MPRLRRIDCSGPGIVRKKRGRGFEYFDEATGQKVDDPEMVDRIRELVIPPAWGDVWICPHPFGHIQAIGTDAAERKQYMYHQKWRERRDAEKFEEMLEFARRLTDLRKMCESDLSAGGMPCGALLLAPFVCWISAFFASERKAMPLQTKPMDSRRC